MKTLFDNGEVRVQVDEETGRVVVRNLCTKGMVASPYEQPEISILVADGVTLEVSAPGCVLQPTHFTSGLVGLSVFKAKKE